LLKGQFSAQTIKGKNMANMLVQHKVKDYSAWKQVYDSVAGFRHSSGELADQIFHDASDSNKLTLLFKWDTLANAQKFAQSAELRAAMERAGVDGMPVITFLTEA
jgi:antibiotic biosynthesis monooxygenase (ABM) superfamily enzyme